MPASAGFEPWTISSNAQRLTYNHHPPLLGVAFEKMLWNPLLKT